MLLTGDENIYSTEVEIATFRRENMALYKAPKPVDFIDELPKFLAPEMNFQRLRPDPLSFS